MNNAMVCAISSAWEAIVRQKKRAGLTILAISIGIASVIIIIAAGKGMERMVLAQLDVFGPDTLYIETHVPHTAASGPGSVGITITTLRERDITDVSNHPNIAAAFGQVIGQETVSYSGQLKKIMLIGKGYQAPEIENLQLSEGRFFSENEESSLTAVAVLGSAAKEKLFGNDSALNKILSIKGKPYKVIGVSKPLGSAFFFDMDNVITIPTKTMQKRLLGIDYVQAISARMKDGSKAEETRDELTELIRQNHRIAGEDPGQNDFVVNTTADARKSLLTITNGITFLLVALIGISLITGGIGIMNIMYVSVVERTFEIGLRKSIGAREKDILWQFLAEAIMVTASGGIVGVAAGAIIAYAIYALAISFGLVWIYSVSISSVFLSVIFSAFIGLIFGYFPARQAARKNPIDALRFE